MTIENSITPEVGDNSGASITFVEESAASKPFSDEQQAFLDEQANPTEDTGLIFGKYKTMEEAEKAHKSLETGFHDSNQSNSDLPSEPRTEPVSDDNNIVTEELLEDSEESDEALNKLTEVEYDEGTPEHNIQSVVNDYLETGEMSAELEQNFKDIGIPKELAERHRELMEYKNTNVANDMFGLVGGKENYAAMSQWAESNMSQGEQDNFNSIMETGHIENIQSAIKNLDARYKQSNNQPHSNLIKADAISSSSAGYESQAQMIADMSDPRYDNDEAYRAKVYAKVERSNL